MSIEALVGIIAGITSIIVGGLAILGTLIGGFVWLSGKLEHIRKDIAKLDKDSVSHAVCEKRREQCPCFEDIEELKDKLGK
nr:MAG TPA: Lipopolysaccharide assembly protein A domain [Caudoviricetes sp.]